MLERLTALPQQIKQNKLTTGLVLVGIILLLGGFFIFQKLHGIKAEKLLEDITLNFDAEGPYAILTPRRDGNALILNIKRIASFDSFSYQITYTDKTGVERGAGDLNTWIQIKDEQSSSTNKKSDYEQEILLGTCSQGFTSGKSHCVFDEGVENGTLTLRIRKGKQPYRMLSQWHLQKPDVALGELTSGDGHFKYKIKAEREDLALIGFTVINDLTGVPKLPEGKQVMGKVYSLNLPTAKELKEGNISLELAESPPVDAKLARYAEEDNKWIEMDTKVGGSKLSASGKGDGIYAILVGVK